ncbi:hypothetical protein [Mammaliicoccus sciuri]|uniref:hypothetical protein n=1 Tax=Mammaliicoccus sciuri TaxID=1296 RepID=UPI002883958A|nr:hypothetical protein [Mammaliicoccus sciuri]MDT0753993.1 hypothetical protein [Mammaliicoccus sciuri]
MTYEKFILSLLTSLAIKKKNKAYYVISNEIKNVYTKAKLFDEILNIDLDQHEIIVHGQVEDIVNKYMEDK